MSIIEKSFSINLKILTMFGLYPPKNITSFYCARSYFLYLMCVYPISILGLLYFILEEEIDEQKLGDDAFVMAETTCQITKLFPFVVNGNRMKQCIQYLEDPMFEAKNIKHKKIMEKCINICQRNSNVFLISVIVGSSSWALRPFFGSQRQLPVDVWLPFNITSNFQYCSVYSLLVIDVGFIAITSAILDPLIGGLACLAAGQFQILKENLQNLSDASDNKSTGIFDKNIVINNKIKQCIKHHNAILHFLEEYEHCFSLPVFSQFAGSVIVICFGCFQVSKLTPMSFSFMSVGGCLCLLLTQIYFYCYYGTILYEESNTLTQAIYMGMWYEYDVESRKALILLMERSKRPVIITAGKILDLSIATFTEILKRSYSILALLKNQ